MKKLLLFLPILFSCAFSQAQNHTVRGIIYAKEVIPLKGVAIKIQSTKKTVFTDSNGKFELVCDKNDKLKLKARGFYTESVKISEKVKVVAVNMKLKSGEKSRVYAIGYGYVSEQDKTSTVSTRNVGSKDYAKYRSVNAIIEQMGAQERSGEFILRGENSINSSSAALIVIDGIISSYDILQQLKPFHLKRVDILQDAAASVYGSRGSNGVILIETLNGR
jgi:TonB-dependent SusC/RagA subfamily outer membrane receptor